MLCFTTERDGHSIRSRMVDEIGNLCHEPPTKIYGIQMERGKLQIIWLKNTMSTSQRTHKSHPSTKQQTSKVFKDDLELRLLFTMVDKAIYNCFHDKTFQKEKQCYIHNNKYN